VAKHFGEVPGVKVGDFFEDRATLSQKFVHRPPQGGISGNATEGADSIVMSGGYSDDLDFGDYILYTGHGGQNPSTHKQVADQSVDDTGNAGLITSHLRALPVRVIRGWQHKSPFSPPVGYRYAGLFMVTDHTLTVGQDGFLIVRFRLERVAEQDPYISNGVPEKDPAYATTTVTRRIRDSALVREVKAIYEDACQLCGLTLVGVEGRRYSEGAHVRPLGKPHLGADKLDNILCLCPNHHAQLDLGGLLIDDDMSVSQLKSGSLGVLTFKNHHALSVDNATYHRKHWTALAQNQAVKP
jgi:putative restriction endonuclease